MEKSTAVAHGTFSKKIMVILLALLASALIALPACSSSDDKAQGADASGQQEQSAADGSAAQQAGIEVTIAVAANEDKGVAAEEIAVTVEEGATVYDALMASGLDVVASDSDYGKFVESIAGVAGDDTSGWVYTVNGESPTVGCDAYELAAGDVAEWSLTTW